LPQTTSYRWTVVALLFFATSINYIDRQVIGLLKPVLTQKFNWSNTTFGNINAIFQFFYAAGLLLFGKIIDSIGTKKGYTIAIVTWSIAAISHAFASTTFAFTAVRSLLGLGEAGNFPSAIKSVAEWFPKKARALATGIFNSGSNIGAVIAPILVPWVLANYGWQEAFVVTGALGFVWLIFWLWLYEIPTRKKNISAAEYNYIHSDNEEDTGEENSRPVKWLQLLKIKQTWAFVLGKFLTDPIWWFFLFWLPGYFNDVFQLDLAKPGWPLVIVYTGATIGSIGGGYLSSFFIQKGWKIYRARKTAMFIFAICVVPVFTARYFENMWMVVALITIAGAAHQAWSANIFTIASDMFPKKTVSSVVGIGGMAGSVGAILFQPFVGEVLDYFQQAGNKNIGYNLLFAISACAYLIAWLLMHFIIPQFNKVKL
jgi:ACS family hexuronate transporter-like MFS transporter